MAERLTPTAPLARFVFRGAAAARDAASQAFGVGLPQTALRATQNGSRAALWQGPDEWLLLAPLGEGAEISASLATALGQTAYACVDVSHRQLGFTVSGDDAADLLNAACPLDLRVRTFGVGMTTRTLFGKCDITLWRQSPTCFHIEVGRSFAPYLRDLLAEAGRSA